MRFGQFRRVSVAEKSPFWVTLKATGRPGHGSAPHDDNVLDRMVRAMRRIQAWEREPMTRLRTWLINEKLWSEAEEVEWKAECSRLTDIEVDAYLATKLQPVESMFDHLYADMPADLAQQRAEALAWEQRGGAH